MNYCPHCLAGESSIWDSVFDHYAHPDLARPGKLKFCHEPWRQRLPIPSSSFEVVEGRVVEK